MQCKAKQAIIKMLVVVWLALVGVVIVIALKKIAFAEAATNAKAQTQKITIKNISRE